MNNFSLKGKALEVSMLIKKEKNKNDRTPVTVKPSNNLFVKNLPTGFDDSKLKELFEKFGAIESASVKKNIV